MGINITCKKYKNCGSYSPRHNISKLYFIPPPPKAKRFAVLDFDYKMCLVRITDVTLVDRTILKHTRQISKMKIHFLLKKRMIRLADQMIYSEGTSYGLKMITKILNPAKRILLNGRCPSDRLIHR